LSSADLHGLVHVVRQRGIVVDDLHRAPTEHVRRPHDDRVADLVRDREGLVDVVRNAVRRLPDVQPLEQRLEQLSILADRRCLDGVPRMRHAGRLQPFGEVERRLPAELHDHADRARALADVQHVLGVSGSKNSRSDVS
jgi:hypothetical protein